MINKLKKYLTTLDKYQSEIVASPANENLLCIAGPGAGKSHSIICRALKLVIEDNINPSSMVLFTFTRKAANELKTRYLKFWGQDTPQSIPHISTIHSFCYELIKGYVGIAEHSFLSDSNIITILRSTFFDLTSAVLPHKEAKRLDSLISTLAKDGETHALIFPVLDISGNLIEVISRNEAKQRFPQGIQFLDNFSYTALKARYQNESFDEEELVGKINNQANDFQPYFADLVAEFFKQKWGAKKYSFDDMTTLLMYYIAQYPDVLTYIHQRYKYYICDEFQDSFSTQFAIMLVCDKMAYDEYLNKGNV